MWDIIGLYTIGDDTLVKSYGSTSSYNEAVEWFLANFNEISGEMLAFDRREYDSIEEAWQGLVDQHEETESVQLRSSIFGRRSKTIFSYDEQLPVLRTGEIDYYIVEIGKAELSKGKKKQSATSPPVMSKMAARTAKKPVARATKKKTSKTVARRAGGEVSTIVGQIPVGITWAQFKKVYKEKKGGTVTQAEYSREWKNYKELSEIPKPIVKRSPSRSPSMAATEIASPFPTPPPRKKKSPEFISRKEGTGVISRTKNIVKSIPPGLSRIEFNTRYRRATKGAPARDTELAGAWSEYQSRTTRELEEEELPTTKEVRTKAKSSPSKIRLSDETLRTIPEDLTKFDFFQLYTSLVFAPNITSLEKENAWQRYKALGRTSEV